MTTSYIAMALLFVLGGCTCGYVIICNLQRDEEFLPCMILLHLLGQQEFIISRYCKLSGWIKQVFLILMSIIYVGNIATYNLLVTYGSQLSHLV